MKDGASRAVKVGAMLRARRLSKNSFQHEEAPLELEVADFGPIVRAKVELRPLTVFVGPSNTGKSVLAVLCYALHQFFGDFPRQPWRFWNRSLGRSWSDLRRDLRAEDLEESRRWLTGVVTNGPGRRRGPALDLPQPVARLVRTALADLPELGKELSGEIARCFGVGSAADLVRYAARGGASVSVRHRPGSGPASEASFGYRFATRQSALTTEIPEQLPLRLASGSERNWMLAQSIGRGSPEDDPWNPELFVASLNAAVMPQLAGGLSRRAWYLPADRSGVMHAHRAVVASLVRRASRAGITAEEPIPALSGVLADFLELLVGLGDGPGRRRGTRLAQRLEESLLGGAIGMTMSESGYPLFWWRPEGWKSDLPLARASSMVSELAPVVLWLRHVAGPGDVLIIEEPEAHLHPAMQVAFARELVRLVQFGVRVLVTTHSEWILDAIANLVRLSEMPEDARRDLADAELALPADKVGAWFFEPSRRPRGSIVREIGLDRDAGTFPSGFGLVSEDLYNQWADITNRIHQP